MSEKINSEHKSQASPMFGLLQSVKSWDMFGVQVPTFNIRGIEVVKTSAGACASLLIILLTLMFAILKLLHLV